MKKKTLVIIYWDLGIGGIQKRIRDFVFDMSRYHDDWNIHILLRRKAREGFDGQIQVSGKVFLHYYPHSTPLRMRLGFVVWIARQIIQLQPQVILTFLYVLSPVVVMLKRLLWWMHVKVVLNEGIVTSYNLAHRHATFFPMLIRLTYPHADTVIVPTQACKEDLVQNFFVPPAKITVIPNWTCLSPVTPLASTFDILYVGRFHPEKKPLTIVHITQLLVLRHPNIHVGMMGNGELLNKLQTAIQSANLSDNIRILPFSQSVASVLRRSKILVVPSFVEGMPNVVLEAAMCSVPAVINRFPGAHEVVRHGVTGYVSGTDEKAAKYIDNLLTHDQKRRRMGERARQYVEAAFSFRTQKRFIDALLSQ